MAQKTGEVSAPHAAFAIEKDLHILPHASLFALYALMNSDDPTDPDVWFRNATNKDFADDYHQTFLRMLNFVDAPHSHWLLKSHGHKFYMKAFLRHSSHALLVMTRRSPDEVCPSHCRLIVGSTAYNFDSKNSGSRVPHSAKVSEQFIGKMHD